MSEKYYFLLGGGIGDAVLHYMHDPILRKLPAIHEARPNLEVYAFSQVHNNGVEDLFWYHPVIKRHVQIVQLPQFKGYEEFDRSLIPTNLQHYSEIDHIPFPVRDPVFNLSDFERRRLDEIFDGRPVTVIQPFAGLSERDAFDEASLKELTSRLPGKKVVIGSNAPRVYSERVQKISDPSVVNLIDSVGIRFTWHLISRCDAFVGCHSSIVLLAWHHNKPTVCIIPSPFLDHHWEHLDPRYKEGVGRRNTLIAKFNTHGKEWPRDFDFSSLNHEAVSQFLSPFLGDV